MRQKLLLTTIICLILTFSLSIAALGCPKPVINEISPASGVTGDAVNVTINGSKIRKNAVVKLVSEGQPDIIASDINVVSKKEINCMFDLKGANVGKWDLVVANIGRFSKKPKPTTVENAFSVEYPAPTISSVNPAKGFNSHTRVPVVVFGTGFKDGASVKLVKDNKNVVEASNIRVVSETSLTCDLNLTNAGADTYDLTVTNADGKGFTLANGFSVLGAKKPTPAPAPEPKVNPNSLLKPIFFDYDSYSIRNDQLTTLKINLEVLKKNPKLYVVLGGHADERGTVKYNLVLSAKRAEALKKYLVQNGISSRRIILFAYGKLHPAKKGHSETIWWFNRRVDISVWKVAPSKNKALKENMNILLQ